MSDRKQNRTENGTELLQEIRARLDAFDTEKPWVTVADAPLTGEMTSNVEWQDAISHAPADIAWLIGEVERLGRRLDFETRLVADLEAQLDRAHERYAAEVERRRGDA